MSQELAWNGWAQYYDAVDGDRASSVDFYGSLVTRDVQSVLEIACGTGRITSALADRLASHNADLSSVRIVGIDESPEMLRLANARDDRVTWILGDMRTPVVDRPFDLVICCYNSLQLMLTDQDFVRTLRAVRRLLSPNGVFAFDIYQPNQEHLTTRTANRLARTVVDDQGRRLEIREDTAYNPETRILSVDWRLVEHGADRSPLALFCCQLRQYSSDELKRMLTIARLEAWERYGDLNRSPFTAVAKKQVMVCRPV